MTKFYAFKQGDKCYLERRKEGFDLSKFTVVGSPTITDDGVASGFTNSNYLDTKFLINTDVVIKGSFTLSSKTSSTVGQLFSIGNASDNNGLRFVVATSGFLQMAQLQTWINYVWEAKYVINIPIFYEVIISGTSVNLKLTQNNTEIANVSGTVPNNINGTISLGRELATGSIDLTQFSITVDDKEVFTGAKEKFYAMKGGK